MTSEDVSVHSLPDKLAKNFFDEPSQAQAVKPHCLLIDSRMLHKTRQCAAGFCDVCNDWTRGD